jgi:general secretion pathway protein D|tara:strand:- start:5526 stop:7457 length:1932 start_codon:yes stop_codon:yes gene_type:complete
MMFKDILLKHRLIVVAVGWALSACLSMAYANSINFRKADIGLFIETVADITQKNFVVDPRVKGQVTVISNEAMSKTAVYDVFLSVLDVHGFVALPEGEAVKIVPNINSRFSGAGTGDGIVSGALVTQIIQVKKARAGELVPLLRPLLPLETHFASLESSNQLVISTTQHHVNRISNLVKRLDIQGQTHSQVVMLQNANAVEVEALLSRLQQTPAGITLAGVAVVADERSNSLILMQSVAIDAAIFEVIEDLDRPVAQALVASQQVKVLYLKYADAQKLAPMVEQVAQGGLVAAQTSEPAAFISVQADSQLNALIIAAPVSLMFTLENLVDQLDVRRAQILVEAVIAEVSSKHAAELGMQWALAGNGVSGITSFSDNSLVNLYANPLAVGSGITLGIGTLMNGGGQGMAGILRALTSDADTNIVSTPSIVTLDNEEAEIVVGQNVPFVTGQYNNASDNSSSTAKPFQTIQRENVGVKLKILPKINHGDSISLSISQEVSSLSSQSISASDIVTNTRTIKTNVIAGDQDLIVLGGLIDDQMVDTTEKIPFLGDLPVLGAAFRYRKSNLTKRNLVVFIRPTIVRDDSMLESLSHRKYQFLRAKQILLNKSQDNLLSGRDKPLLGDLQPIFEQQGEPEQSAPNKANW